MRPPPEKNRIMLDFCNKIRYILARQHVSTSARQHVSTSARQHVSTSARQHAITAPLISTKNFIPFFSFIIRLPRSPTPPMRSSLFIRLCRDRMGEVFCIIHKNRINKVVTSLMREKNNQKGDLL